MITGIRYICARGTSGYAEAAKDYIIGLKNKGIPITVEFGIFDDSLYQIGERNEIVNSLLDKKIKYNKIILHCTPEHWEKYIKKYKTKDTEIIGMTVWETDRLHPQWAKFVNEADRIIVPCTWNKKVFKESGVKKTIEIIPHIYKPLKTVSGKINEINDEFIFYSISQWTHRKGFDDLVKAYLNEFTSNDKVVLILKTFRSSYGDGELDIIRKELQSIIKGYKNPAKIVLLLRQLTDEQMSILHNTGHCYVSLCKAEGFGLGIFEATGAGKPIICTGYGGQIDFVKDFLVNYKLIPADGMPYIKWYRKTQNWAQPDINHASSLMRFVFENYSTAQTYALNNQKNVQQNFNSEVVINKLVRFLNE